MTEEEIMKEFKEIKQMIQTLIKQDEPEIKEEAEYIKYFR